MSRRRPPLAHAVLLAGGFVAAALAGGAAAVYWAASSGYFPAHADAPAPAWEKWFARLALDAAIARNAPKTDSPLPPTDRNLMKGLRLYGENCLVCHGGPDARSSKIALGLYQKAPQLARYGVEDDEDGEVYWVVAHGIRMTGMPAFRETLTEDELWSLVLFLKNMDSLPPGPARAWRALGRRRIDGR